MAVDKIYLPAETLAWDYSEHLGLDIKESSVNPDYIGVQVGGGRLAITAMERQWAEREAAGECAPQVAGIVFHPVPEGVTSSDAAAALLSSEHVHEALPKLKARKPLRFTRLKSKRACSAVVALQASLVTSLSPEATQHDAYDAPHHELQVA